MLVLGIDKATAHLVSLHINQIEFHYSGDITIVLLCVRTLLRGHLQEYTRSQGHLVVTSTNVSFNAGRICGLIVQIGLTCYSCTIFVTIRMICLIVKAHITSKVTQTIYYAVDTKIVTV